MEIKFDDIVGLLEQIVEWFESVAPTVWQIMMKKTLADTIINLMVGGLGVVGLFVAFRWKAYCAKNWDEIYTHDLEPWHVLGIVLLAFASLVAAFQLFAGIKMLIAPEYYTIQQIFSFIK